MVYNAVLIEIRADPLTIFLWSKKSTRLREKNKLPKDTGSILNDQNGRWQTISYRNNDSIHVRGQRPHKEKIIRTEIVDMVSVLCMYSYVLCVV